MKSGNHLLNKNKRLGQHFLTDLGHLDKITDALQLKPEQHIIEIGAGDGALTQRLVATGAQVTALEFDKRCIAILKRKFNNTANLRIIAGNALTIPTDSLLNWGSADTSAIDLTSTPTRMVGNLPYNISSQIILRFIKVASLVDLHFLIQRELANKLIAQAGTRKSSRFTLAALLWRRSQALFDIPPQAFDPPPAVFSTLVRLGAYQPRSNSDAQAAIFDQLISLAFQQRRKQLGNCLAKLVDRATLTQLGIDSNRRAESLAIEDWLKLATALNQQ